MSNYVNYKVIRLYINPYNENILIIILFNRFIGHPGENLREATPIYKCPKWILSDKKILLEKLYIA